MPIAIRHCPIAADSPIVFLSLGAHFLLLKLQIRVDAFITLQIVDRNIMTIQLRRSHSLLGKSQYYEDLEFSRYVVIVNLLIEQLLLC